MQNIPSHIVTSIFGCFFGNNTVGVGEIWDFLLKKPPSTFAYLFCRVLIYRFRYAKNILNKPL